MIRPSGFFVLRAPLLPWEELDRLRVDPLYVHSLVARPEVAEALHLASPSLLRRWSSVPADSRVTAAITAYLVRMCSRPTPFGLFAGCATGAVSEITALVVDGPDGTVRHSRPDTEVLATLVERMLADPVTRPQMAVEPNTSRYHAAGALRIIDSRMRAGRRSHHLVVVDEDAPLRSALWAAVGGATVGQVATAVEAGTDAEPAEVRDYVDALIDAQVLTAVAEPGVTGRPPLEQVTSALRGQGFPEIVNSLDKVGEALANLDAAGLGNAPDGYSEVSRILLELAGGGDESRLIQVDLHRAGTGLTLGPDVIGHLTAGVELLHRVSPAAENAALNRFKDAFRTRYEDRAVPLMEALDEESGVGFDPSTHPAADESPLLAGIDLGGRAAEKALTPRDAALLDLVLRNRDSGAASLELDAAAVARLSPAQPFPLPDALAVIATVLDDGVEINNVFGPSGAQLLGRFCHGDVRLHAAVREHLRAEEAHAPGVVFAEIVHLPEGRTGNILARPVLRDYELVLLGRSGAPTERQISVDELTVRLDGRRLVLHSARLDAEVRPRMSTAHNVVSRGFGVYRFLAALQGDGVARELGWDWGALSAAPSLPRVTAGQLVLSRARWRLSAAELAPLAAADPASGWAALANARGIPSEVLIADGDNRLYVDTASPALTAAAAKVLRGRTEAILEEALPSRVAIGPQGHFAHELIVPFLRHADVAPAGLFHPAPQLRRTFPPDSEWLYLKVYAGTASSDRILTRALGPVLGRLRQDRIVDHWFFLRYADPQHHLRIRLHGSPVALREQALPALSTALGAHLDEGTVWKVALDTYDREIERYGGDAGIELAERIHAADSEAVLRVLGMLDDDDGLDARWKLCLYATDRLLADAGLGLQQRRDWANAGAAAYRREYPNAPNLESSIARRWRVERAEVSRLLDDIADHPFEPARLVFRQRSEQITPLLADLAQAQRRGVLTVPVTRLLYSYNHLHAIRLLRSAARTHELVLHSFLDRYYASRVARGR